MLYTITHMKQYTNASIVFVEVENKASEPNTYFGHARFELTISSDYKCRNSGGSGHEKGIMHYSIPFRLTVKPVKDFADIKHIPREEGTVTFAVADGSEKG